MKKKILTILLVILLLINIVTAILIFIDIQVIGSPETTIKISILEINEKEIQIEGIINVKNPNHFEMITDEFEIVATTEQGVEIARIPLEGGVIPPNSNKTFILQNQISFNGDISGDITSKITGKVGVRFLGIIQKTLPINMKLITSFDKLINGIQPPKISVTSESGKLTSIEKLDLNTNIEVYNPNNFTLYIRDVKISIETESGDIVGSYEISDAEILGQQTTSLIGKGNIKIELLNAKKLYIKINAVAGAIIAGIDKSFELSSTSEFKVPDLHDLFPAGSPIEQSIKSDMKLKLTGLHNEVELYMDNPTNLTLFIKDIVVDFYRIEKEEKIFLVSIPIEGGEVPGNQITIFTGEGIIPLRKFIQPSLRGFLPEWIFMHVGANLTLPGLDLSIPIGLGGYVDLDPLR